MLEIFLPTLLPRLREEKGLSLDEVAERSGIRKETLKNWEDGKTTPQKGEDDLKKLAKGLGLSYPNFLWRLALQILLYSAGLSGGHPEVDELPTTLPPPGKLQKTLEEVHLKGKVDIKNLRLRGPAKTALWLLYEGLVVLKITLDGVLAKFGDFISSLEKLDRTPDPSDAPEARG